MRRRPSVDLPAAGTVGFEKDRPVLVDDLGLTGPPLLVQRDRVLNGPGPAVLDRRGRAADLPLGREERHLEAVPRTRMPPRGERRQGGRPHGSAEFGEPGQQLVDLAEGGVRHEAGEAAPPISSAPNAVISCDIPDGPVHTDTPRRARNSPTCAGRRRATVNAEHRQSRPGTAEHGDVRQRGDAVVEVLPQPRGVRAGHRDRALQPLAPGAGRLVVEPGQMVDRGGRAVEQLDRAAGRTRTACGAGACEPSSTSSSRPGRAISADSVGPPKLAASTLIRSAPSSSSDSGRCGAAAPTSTSTSAPTS